MPLLCLLCRTLVRQVDCVTVKGSNKPIGLFTYDVDVEGIEQLRMSQLKAVSGGGGWQ